MAHTKSAIKRIRQSEDSTLRNRVRKSKIKSAERKLADALAEKNAEGSKSAYSELCSSLDKAAKVGTIKKETAIRRKNRAAKRVKVTLA